jgi:hypothetical protein
VSGETFFAAEITRQMDRDYSFLSFLGNYSHLQLPGSNIKNKERRIALAIDNLTLATPLFRSGS